ncbi:hypothetical protein Q5P01_003409 [Channa striata]|uniref:Uncharacterized protein n=1 Tax=Channa striata TaxID=64152 RepID=A0AA88NH17_CHASR|nr:hypothetical protein Q5P01_003409 [Channa striata]
MRPYIAQQTDRHDVQGETDESSRRRMEEEDKDPVLGVIKWEEFLQDYSKDKDYIHGYVTDETSVESVLELYRRATKATFFTRRSSSFQFDPLKCKNRKFYTRSFVFCRSISPRISSDGVPFMYGGMKTLECQYGPKRDHGKKSDGKTSTISNETLDATDESSEQKKCKLRLSTGESRKKGCQAKISVWHICRFPEYVVTAKKCVTIWQTKAKERLLQDLEVGKELIIENRFYISLPLQKAHTSHIPCGQPDEVHSVHPQVIRWIDELVAKGVTTIREVQALLKYYVQTQMSDIVAPDEQDRAYYPTLKDIANHIYKSKMKQRILKLDLETFGKEEVPSTGGEKEIAGISHDDTPPSSHAILQLNEPESNCEVIIQEVTSCAGGSAYRERKAIHKELNSIRRLSNKCTDAAKLVELKAGIAALHENFRNSVKEQLSSADTQTTKRQKQDTSAPGLPPKKTLRRYNEDHVY